MASNLLKWPGKVASKWEKPIFIQMEINVFTDFIFQTSWEIPVYLPLKTES